MPNQSSCNIKEAVEACFNVYNSLPKTGKPIEKEWTVLSCFLIYDKITKNSEVVSLGTGSKCIGASKMCPSGFILNDSHAEVFARRGFLIYLYENIQRSLNNEQSIFTYKDEQFILKDNIEFGFYSSQLPCGDASIISTNGLEENYGDVLTAQKRKADEELQETEVKKPKLDYVNKTGAKCLPHCEQDVKDTGGDIKLLLGQVRTKPGRGDRTLSVSCSDKIAKWIHMGVQGRLLHMLCGSIYIKHFIFGGGVPNSKESLIRAFLNRPGCSPFCLDKAPEFYNSELIFPHIASDENVKPAPGSIVWIKLKNPVSQVAVQGRRLGVTLKKATTHSLCISKHNIYKTFLETIKNNKDLILKICGQENIGNIPYNVMKRKATKYIEKWLNVKENFFKTWTVKPDLWEFCINV